MSSETLFEFFWCKLMFLCEKYLHIYLYFGVFFTVDLNHVLTQHKISFSANGKLCVGGLVIFCFLNLVEYYYILY